MPGRSLWVSVPAYCHFLGSDLKSQSGSDLVIDDSGATAVEYALLIALIAAVVVGTVTLLGPVVAGLYASVCDELGC
ncbi:hypothetical protein GCM10009668_09680 [Nocardioides dubius]|uniref:Flp family type IVb pilin n=1 Tax=Nocardioides dubius TaxID=317019 RepID=A0ABP4E9Z6_9ACTN